MTPKDIQEYATDTVTVGVSWYEIHNETIQDLFVPGPPGSKEGLRVKDDRRGRFVVEGLTTLDVNSSEQVFELINKYVLA